MIELSEQELNLNQHKLKEIHVKHLCTQNYYRDIPFLNYNLDLNLMIYLIFSNLCKNIKMVALV